MNARAYGHLHTFCMPAPRLHTCAHTCLHICLDRSPHACLHTCLQTCPRAHVRASVHAHMHLNTHLHTCLHTRLHTCLCTGLYPCLYIWLHTRVHKTACIHVYSAGVPGCVRRGGAQRGGGGGGGVRTVLVPERPNCSGFYPECCRTCASRCGSVRTCWRDSTSEEEEGWETPGLGSGWAGPGWFRTLQRRRSRRAATAPA